LSEKLRFRRKILHRQNDVEWVCTDQSNFDLNQPFDWIVYAMRQLYERITMVNPHMSEVARTELKSMLDVNIQIPEAGGSFKWGWGVLSGFKFTALLDSILNRAESRLVFERMGIDDIRFEAYQGDDAILGVIEKVSRVELARQYLRLGLVVHPQKTWISRRRTEYLHEIYMNGGVFGFPARAFKAIAWSSPNVGSGSIYGSAKFRAVLATLLMAYRRGLEVIPMVSHFLRSYIVMPKDRFFAWLCTPTLFGGFGAGDQGRVGIEIETKRERTFRVSVDGVWGDKFRRRSAELRIESACPLPGIRNVYRTVDVVGDKEMPPRRASFLSELGVIRTDWGVRDLAMDRSAYERKLKLEWKLGRGEKILPADLPNGFLGLADPDKSYRRYRKLMNQVLSIETGWSSSEGYAQIIDWANRVWAGLAYQWSRFKVKEWETEKGLLCFSMLKMILLYSRHDMLLSLRV
jgi:hypothetical protein